MNSEVRETIRPAQERDLTGIAELDRNSGMTAWREGDYRAWLARRDAVFFCALKSGRPAGFVLLRAAAGEAELLKIAVDASARGRGIGRALLRAGLAELGRVGCRTVFLEVRPSNAAALRLYLEHGFVQVGRRPAYYRDPEEDALVMRLELKT